MPVNLASPGIVVREVDLTLGNVQTSTDKTGAICQ
ncbi:tail sheath monomer protein [Synechococcus phage ACG-2014f]|uniref:Tail sheath monomer protein n=1 Tax=Synechococcus phage ACG-2014f TaxID=1493511 RepID=A0A0E3HG88_9CAUD|nr:tail sheath monomer protein [Synechococcus phage ACG-2014f]